MKKIFLLFVVFSLVLGISASVFALVMDDDSSRWISATSTEKTKIIKKTVDDINDMNLLLIPYSTKTQKMSAIIQLISCVDAFAPSIPNESIGTAVMLCSQKMKFIDLRK